MLRLSPDQSLAWNTACDEVRTHLAASFAVAPMVGCFLYPSVESALLEIVTLLSDRERETGGERTRILYGRAHDPALETMGKAASSLGFDVQSRDGQELSDIATWLPSEKQKLLFLAMGLNDRFSGEVRAPGSLQVTLDTALAAGVRLPVVTLSFSLAMRSPNAFEIAVTELENGAALLLCGERLRLQPRMAPYLMTYDVLVSSLTLIESASKRGGFDAGAREEIEAFEATLPKPFQAVWPKGAGRVLDRVMITSAEHDGSVVLEKLAKAFAVRLANPGMANPFETLSGCRFEDERRQEWLRARGLSGALASQASDQVPWLIRGQVSIALDFIRTHGADKVRDALSKI